MSLIKTVYGYLRKYPVLSMSAFISIVAASLFEGASFGMLIPLMQSLTKSPTNALAALPITGALDLRGFFGDQARAISVVLALMLAIILLKNVFIYLSNVLIAKLRFSLIRDLSVRLMDNLIDYDVHYFDDVKMGQLVTTMSTETNRIGNLMLSCMRFMALLGKVVSYLTVLLLISFKASILILIIMVGVLIPLEVIMKRLKALGVKISQATAEYNHKLMEIFSAIRLIKSYGTEDSEKSMFKASCSRVADLNYKSNEYISLLIPVSEVVMFAFMVVFFLILVHVVKIDLSYSFPFIATYLVVLVRGLTQVNLLNSLRSEALNNLAAVVNYEEMCSDSGRKTITSGSRSLNKFNGNIEFKNVGFSYDGARTVLEDINITIPKGKVTAIVGASGAGKSTLVNLILRFYDPSSGRITVDGTDLRELSLKDWRRKIGLVSQDIFIFNNSASSNISYGIEGADAKKVIDAAKRAFCHEFIMNLPQKYDTILGERGLKLSGGQKQRLSIARAIIHDPEILILDEATSSLDTETERLIRDAVASVTKDRTVIAIAHRLATVLHADNIIVLDRGRIEELGTHTELISKNGVYKKLYDTQFSVQNAK